MEALRIPLTRGQVAIIDAADSHIVWGYHWHAHKGTGNTSFYARAWTRIDGKEKAIFMHVLLMKPEPRIRVDHINRDGLDNRRENLRFATHQQNMRNMRKRPGQEFKGITFDKREQRWLARICIDGKQRTVCRTTDKIEAALAYDAAALKHFGPFAVLNFPNQLNTSDHPHRTDCAPPTT